MSRGQVTVVHDGPSPEAVMAHLGPRPGSVWLDGGSSRDGWSIVAFDPAEVVSGRRHWVREARTRLRPHRGHSDVPFVGGLIGYVGYGAGHHVAPVPEGPASVEPETWLGRYEGAL
ncbi:MAG: hypothetical protein AAF602_23895, partial [Myxococcota bacterium]